MSFDKPLESMTRRRDLNDIKVIRDGIPAMPPEMRLAAFFDLAHRRVDSDLPTDYSVEVSFRGIRGKSQTLRYLLDLEVFYGLACRVQSEDPAVDLG
jgi:hypothetical protein